MSYDVCPRKWDDGKEHECSTIAGHGGMCVCSCGAQKFIRDTPLRKLQFNHRESREQRKLRNSLSGTPKG